MIIELEDYVIDIKARSNYKSRMNKNDLRAFLNHLSLILDDAYEWRVKKNGLSAWAESYRNDANTLYDICESISPYKS